MNNAQKEQNNTEPQNNERFRVARLQREFCTKDFFKLRIFLRKMLRNFPRNFWAFVLWVSKKSRKIPSKFPTKFSKLPLEKTKKKITDELLQERREKNFFQSKERKRGGLTEKENVGWGNAREAPHSEWSSRIHQTRP